MEFPNLEIHIVHYEKLKKRKTYLDKKIKELGLGKYCTWHIQKLDKDFTELKKRYYKFDEKIWMKRIMYSHDKVTPSIMPRELSQGDMKLGINELQLFDLLAKKKSDKNYLIFEDDVIFEDDFLLKLKKVLEELPKDYDIAYADFGVNDGNKNLSVNQLKFDKLSKTHKRTRATASFFISSKGAKKLSRDIKPFTLPLDHELRYWEVVKEYNAYWLNGYLTYQGTIYGIYPSSLFSTREKTYSNNVSSCKTNILKWIKDIESKRFNKDFFSKTQVFFFDLLISLKKTFFN